MTTSSFFTISCDFYKQNIFPGLTRLQEQQEFVDLTLAADGHIVKVHKNVVALASPYIKELLKTASSDSPVIFLNNVKHELLTYLLEYIYQGEVNVPKENLEAFIQLSQSLHITGMTEQNGRKDTYEKRHVNQSLATNKEQHQIQASFSRQKSEIPNIILQQQTKNLYQKEFTNYLGTKELSENQRDQTSQAECGNQNLRTNIPQKQPNNFKEMSVNQMIPNTVIQQDPNFSQEKSGNQNLGIHSTQGTFNNIESTSSVAACITFNNDQNFAVDKYANIPISNVDKSAPNISSDGVFTTEAIEAMPVVLTTASGVENTAPTAMATSGPPGDLDHTGAAIQQEQTVYPSIRVLNLGTIRLTDEPVDLNNLDKESSDALKTIPQYSTTERGSVQIIVSRYIYNRHHSSRAGRKHRWRCLDYRGLHCPAYIDSFDGRIFARKGLHSHGFHDDKINLKHRKGQISHSCNGAMEAWEKAKGGSTTQYDPEQLEHEDL